MYAFMISFWILVAVALAIYFVVQAIVGAAVLGWLGFHISRWSLNVLRQAEDEIIEGPLSQKFKQTHGQAAPDIWHVGNRYVFEFGGKSYSMPTLKKAKLRRGELLATSLGYGR